MEEQEVLLKAVVTGAAGRMGQMILRNLTATPWCAIYGATERHDFPDLGEDVGELFWGRPNGIMLENDLRHAIIGANVVIDFTSPDASLAHAKICAEAQIPFVCGTTGLKGAGFETFCSHASRTRTVFAPNFSVGINLMLGLAQKAAVVLEEEFDVEIVETHHRNKVDAPSGTALLLARTVGNELGVKEDAIDYGRKGDVGVREYGRIGLHAVRGGDVVGEHELHFFGEGEQITIRHRASSRSTFVRGAIRAALWLQDKAPGLYSMRDVLGI
jgi:4-hydroxy-tetrahydrodipicolinate reductase